MEHHNHIWDESAGKRLLNPERENSEDTSFIKEIFGSEKQVMVDLGCGPGFYAVKLKSYASKLYCIDSSKVMLSMARKTVNDANVIFLEEDSSNLSLHDSSIDVVFMANSFHDMDKEKARKEVMRILKPDGRIIIVDWRKLSENSNEPVRGPPNELRMSEEEYLGSFPGFKISKRFHPGENHFGIVLERS